MAPSVVTNSPRMTRRSARLRCKLRGIPGMHNCRDVQQALMDSSSSANSENSNSEGYEPPASRTAESAASDEDDSPSSGDSSCHDEQFRQEAEYLAVPGRDKTTRRGNAARAPSPRKKRKMLDAKKSETERDLYDCDEMAPNHSLLKHAPVDFSDTERNHIACALLEWYGKSYRPLPWRSTPKSRHNAEQENPSADGVPSAFAPGAPYGVWVSEVMSQQTRLSVVSAYWHRWMRAFPDVHSLANAPLEAVNEVWAGLGYYRRARFLHEAARQVVREHGGQLPRSAAALRRIRGIGPYTAGAIASIAFGERVPAVDGNVERVLARTRPGILANREPGATPGAKAKEYERIATELLRDIECVGDFNQALMELGATVCTPKAPGCRSCPIRGDCGAFKMSMKLGVEHSKFAQQFPAKDVKRKVKVRDENLLTSVYYRNQSETGIREYLLRQRPASGLLAGLWECPNILLSDKELRQYQSGDAPDIVDAMHRKIAQHAPGIDKVHFRGRIGSTTHVFSHIRQQIHVQLYASKQSRSNAKQFPPKQEPIEETIKYRWLSEADIDDSAIPVQMRKVLQLAFDATREANIKPRATN